jgi:hypothetical protein
VSASLIDAMSYRNLNIFPCITLLHYRHVVCALASNRDVYGAGIKYFRINSGAITILCVIYNRRGEGEER